MKDVWADDLLDYSKTGATFQNLVQTLDEAKVISIEAGFGRGKTFFRHEWAKQLRASGEVVIEVDAQQSDHSGDPIVTLLAALVEALPKDEGRETKSFAKTKKFGVIGGRAVARMALRSGADEVFEAMSDKAIDELGDFDALDNLVKDLGDGMSKAAGQLIATQMAAERVRKTELPEQLNALQSALTEQADTNRVIIIIDELDRCHPTYAIAVLEAMKLVFGQSGFVFCLMINAEYLEKLARHQLGVSSDDEKYLDKFVDIRLRLQPTEESTKNAVKHLAQTLPLQIPYGDSDAFSVETAAQLAADLAIETNLSMRKIKRTLLQVELALRCYSAQPLDAPLLVFLAFEEAVGSKIRTVFLPRVRLTPELGKEALSDHEIQNQNRLSDRHDSVHKTNAKAMKLAPELTDLPKDRYDFPDDKNYHPFASVFKYLAPKYLPLHRDALGAVADLLV